MNTVVDQSYQPSEVVIDHGTRCMGCSEEGVMLYYYDIGNVHMCKYTLKNFMDSFESLEFVVEQHNEGIAEFNQWQEDQKKLEEVSNKLLHGFHEDYWAVKRFWLKVKKKVAGVLYRLGIAKKVIRGTRCQTCNKEATSWCPGCGMVRCEEH